MKMYGRAITVLVLIFPCLVEADNDATPTRLRIPAHSIKAKAEAGEHPLGYIYLGLEEDAALGPLKKIRVEGSYGEDSEEESMSMSGEDSEEESMSMSGEDSEEESMSMSSMPITMPTLKPTMMPTTTPTMMPTMTPTSHPTFKFCRWFEHTCDDGTCVGIMSTVGCPCDDGEQRCGVTTYYGGYCAPVCCLFYEKICYDHFFTPTACASLWGGVCPSDLNTMEELLKSVA